MKKTKLFFLMKRAAMTLLLAVVSITTAWADEWPAYVTDVVVFATKKDNRDGCIRDWRNKGYTVIEKDLNDGAVTFAYNEIYFAYKTGSRESTNKGYITDLVVLNVDDAPETWQHNGRTYHKSPYEDNCHYGYSFDGNLNYLVSEAWDLYLYYTKDNFADKRAVSGITINDTKSGSIDCYDEDGSLEEAEINFNRGALVGDDIYMHLTTTTKTNRPKNDPAGRGGLKYNGYYQHLMTGGDIESGTMYYQVENHIFFPDINSATAKDAGTYKVTYYADANEYSDKSANHSKTVTIGKSANNYATVSCGPTTLQNTPSPSVRDNLSKGSVTYLYSSAEDGEYSETAPSYVGIWWVKATIAADSNCDEYTTAPASFQMTEANLDFADNADNSSVIDSHDGEYVAATLKNRTLYRDGRWNTLCLPFDVSTLEGSALEGATVKTLASTSFANGKLTLNFSDDVTSIEAGKPYIIKWQKKAFWVIKGYSDWNAIAASIEKNNADYTGETFLLATDLNVSKMMGTQEHPFRGTFDGQGHTLTFNMTSDGDYCAPFGNVDGATIKDLHVAGTITTSHQFAAGLVGSSSGNTTISNCRSSVTISSTVNGDGTHGGFVGIINDGNVNFSDCLFDGTLTGSTTTNCGGFVGWTESNNDATVNFSHCLFNPAEVDLGGGCNTFARARQGSSVNIHNGFYKEQLGECQGVDASNMDIIQLGFGLGSNWEISGTELVPKMSAGLDNIVNPLFSGVTVGKTLKNVQTQYVDFVGTFSPIEIEGEDRSMYYMGVGNKLYYPNAPMTIGSCRAYFRLKGITPSDQTSGVDEFVINFENSETTDISPIVNSPFSVLNSEWYDLQGRRVANGQKPMDKGVYIHNGRKVVIK